MKKTYSPKQFGELINRSTRTLQEWDRKKILVAHRTPTNRRFYTHEQYLQIVNEPFVKRRIAIYCRVSSKGQSQDLIRQKAALEQFCHETNRTEVDWYEDIGSGLDYKREDFTKLMKQVENEEIAEIIIAYEDRLVRFGYEWFEQYCEDHGTHLVVMNHQELSPEEELTQDLLSIIHTFSSRLYGLRRYQNRLNRIIRTQEE